ncbi:unnamed protein product, partial [Aphanomyces euteiches]
AAADHLDGLVAKISPVQRDVRKVLKEFREFRGSHVKKEDYDRVRSAYEKVVKEKQEQERQGVKKEDYERLRNDHKASEKDRENRIEEIRALKLDVERLTQARDKYSDQVNQQDRDREKHAKTVDPIGRLRRERNGAREEMKRLQSDQVTLGHRFLNWALKSYTLSSPDTADLVIRAWLNDKGILVDERSRDAWAVSNGFTMSPGEPDESAKPFVLPAASPPTDPRGGSEHLQWREIRSTDEREREEHVKVVVQCSRIGQGGRDGARAAEKTRSRSDQESPAPGPDSLRVMKGEENPSGSIKKPKAADDNRGGKTKPASAIKSPDKGKKRVAPVPVDTSKRPCPSGPPTHPRGPLSHEELTETGQDIRDGTSG